MCDSEILFRSSVCFSAFRALEIALVKPICDKLDRSISHSLEFLLHKRRYGNNCRSLVKHFLLHFLVPSFGCLGHLQVLEIEYPGPRVAEIGDPRKSGFTGQSETYQMHRLRRSCTHDQIHGMFRKIFLKKSHRRPDPKASRIRTEKVSTDPHSRFLQKRFMLGIDRIDLYGFLAVP